MSAFHKVTFEKSDITVDVAEDEYWASPGKTDGLPPLERTRLPYATLAFSILSSSKSVGLL